MQAQATQLQSQLATQVQINRELMVRKQDVEWQLVTALAQVALPSSSSPEIGNSVMRVMDALYVTRGAQMQHASGAGAAPWTLRCRPQVRKAAHMRHLVSIGSVTFVAEFV